MQQQALFHEDIYSALRTDCLALGGLKAVGSMLWPSMSVDKAGEKLSDCLNRDRAQKLDPEQVLFIKHESSKSGSMATAFYESEQCSFTKPERIEPESEFAKLQREFVEAQKAMGHMMQRMEDLSFPVHCDSVTEIKPKRNRGL